MNNNEMTQQLFKAIDAIVNERIRSLPYDKTIVATIADISSASKGKYTVTTDSSITFEAYSDNPSYKLNERVYIRVPENNYSKQKVITGKYIPDNNKNKLTIESNNSSTTINSNEELIKQISELEALVKQLLQRINALESNIGEKGE